MKIIVLIGLIGNLLTHNIGVAENEHYINFSDGTGYYVEDENLINEGDVVLELNDKIVVLYSLNNQEVIGMNNIDKLIKDGHVQDLKELLIFLAVDGKAIENFLEDMYIKNIDPDELRQELYKSIQTLNI